MSLRLRIVLFALGILLPALVAGGWIMASSLSRDQAAREVQVRSLAHALLLASDQELERRAAVLQLLGASPAMQSMDLVGFCNLARSAMQGSHDPIVLVDRERLIVSTGLSGCLASPAKNLVPEQFTEKGVVLGDLFRAGVNREFIMAINSPLIVEGKLYNLAVGVRPAQLQAILESYKLPTDWKTAIVNRQGRVLARYPDPEKWVGQLGANYAAQPLSVGLAQRTPVGNGEGVIKGRAVDGAAMRIFYNGSDKYGITVYIGIPEAVLEAARLRTLRDELIGAMLLLATAVAIALWVAHRIAAPVEALVAAAFALKAGEPVQITRSDVTELNRIGLALEIASETIRSHNTAMSRRVASAVAEVESAQARLVQSQKLEVIGKLTGGIAHDFNNILQTLSTGLQVLEVIVTDPKAVPLIEAGSRAVNRATRLVQQLLALGRRATFVRQPVDLRNHLLAMEVLLSKTLSQNVTLKLDLAPDLWSMSTDPSQLEVALLNMIFNARDALPRGGEIVIRARNETCPNGQAVSIQVVDNGTGIAPEILPQIFDPFFTTKPVGLGAGLGLAQVRDFANASGGSVGATSVEGVGTTVTLWLPRSAEAAAVEAAPVAAEMAVHSYRVLFVEDDILIAEVVASALSGAGFAVSHARTGDEALAAMREGQQFDVVFSDVVMPGMVSGLELANVLRDEFPAVPIVLASGYAAEPTSPVVSAILSKPYSVQALIQALLAAIRGS